MKNPLLLAALLCVVAPLGAAAPVLAQEQPTAARTFGSHARLAKFKRSGKHWNATATYPIFRAATPLARYASWQTRLEAETRTNAHVAEFKKYLAEDETSDEPYEFGLTPRLAFYGSKLISLQQSTYYYAGGAHPNSDIATRNYGMSGARPKLLALGDFFRPGSNYRAPIAAKILAKLKAQGADWVLDGTIKNLETDQLNNFSAGKDGLKWIFSPYEMGPYSAGYIEAKLSLKELGPDFRRELLRQ